MPLYAFARTMLGDGVTMASLRIAVAGPRLALSIPRRSPCGWRGSGLGLIGRCGRFCAALLGVGRRLSAGLGAVIS
jgi:hypothetical protein